MAVQFGAVKIGIRMNYNGGVWCRVRGFSWFVSRDKKNAKVYRRLSGFINTRNVKHNDLLTRHSNKLLQSTLQLSYGQFESASR